MKKFSFFFLKTRHKAYGIASATVTTVGLYFFVQPILGNYALVMPAFFVAALAALLFPGTSTIRR